MRGKLGTGKHLDETHILLPQNVPATEGVTLPGSDVVVGGTDVTGPDTVQPAVGPGPDLGP